MSARKVKRPEAKGDKDGKSKKRKKPYWLEVTECIAIAVGLAIFIRTVILEAFKIPTKSMEPTLIGDESYGDRIIAAKWAYRSFFGLKDDRPSRWEVAVFLFDHDRAKKNYIKRCIGLPGEQIAVYRGNIYVNGNLERKPDRVQRGLWHTLYDDDLNSYTGPGKSHARTGEPLPWKLRPGWSLQDGALGVDARSAGAPQRASEIVYDGPLLNIYVPPRPYELVCPEDGGGCGHKFVRALSTVRNRVRCPGCGKLYTNAASDLVADSRGEKSIYGIGQERPVGDLRVSFDLTFEKPGGTVFARIAKDSRVFTLKLPLGEGDAEIAGDASVEERAPVKLSPHRQHRIAFAHYDQRLVAWLDGREILSKDYEVPGESWPETTLDRISSRVSLGAEGASARLDSLRIERDVYYLPTIDPPLNGVIAARVENLGPGEFWMMGDNSPASRDSRAWGRLEESKLIGKALFIWWPPDRIGWVR